MKLLHILSLVVIASISTCLCSMDEGLPDPDECNPEEVDYWGNLPPELIVEIAKRLPLDSLVRFSLTCRRNRDLCVDEIRRLPAKLWASGEISEFKSKCLKGGIKSFFDRVGWWPISFSPDGSFVVIKRRHSADILDRNFNVLRTLPSEGCGGGIAISNDGSCAVIEDENGISCSGHGVRIFARDKKLIGQWASDSEVCLVKISVDGRLVGTGHEDGSVSIWDRDRGLLALETGGNACTFALSANAIVTGHEDGVVRIFDLNGNLKRQWDTQNRVRAVAISADNGLVATGHENGDIKVFDTDGMIGQYNIESSVCCDGLEISADGILVVARTSDYYPPAHERSTWVCRGTGHVDSCILINKAELRPIKHENLQSRSRKLAFVNGDLVVTFDNDTVYLWNLDGKLIRQLHVEEERLNHDHLDQVKISSDGRCIFAFNMNSAFVWRVGQHEEQCWWGRRFMNRLWSWFG